MLTKEDFIENLKKHLNEIDKKSQEIQQGIADLNILVGHKNECLYWIEKFENKDFQNVNVKNFNIINKTPITLDEFKKFSGVSDVKLMKKEF